jgi:hypothetical protein
MTDDTTATGTPEGSLTDPSLLATPRPPRRVVRRIATWVLVVLFALLLPLSLTSTWAVRTVVDTNRYVDTLQPLAQDPVVTNYVADRATTLLFEQLNVQQQVQDILPSAAAPLAAPLTNQLKTYANVEMRKVVSSPWFADFWRKENTYTHATALSLLTGKTPPSPSTARNLVVALSPALIQAIDALDARGVTVFNPIKAQLENNRDLTLQLFSSKQIKAVQGYLNLAIELKSLLIILTIVVGVGAVAVATNRRRGAIRVLGAGIISVLVLLAGLTVGRSFFINAVQPDAQTFATHLWDLMVRFLRRLLIWSLVVLVVADLAVWITGPSTWAVAFRRTAGSSSKKVAAKTGEAYRSERTVAAIARSAEIAERAGTFTRANLVPLRWAGVIVAGIFLFFTSTTAGLWWIAVLLVLYEGAISLPTLRSRAAARRALGAGSLETPKQLDASKK